MNLKVINSYTTKYIKPIVLSKGDIVKLGKEEKQEKWLGWIWAESDNNSGWIPKQIVKSEDGITGIITENYTAKELNANADDILSNIRELNGWLWVKNIRSGEEGWIPKENVERIIES
ncbi:MAG: hypothetical protein IPL53_14535 [Ignavibacteria bacterium]|nr:hypothetical protein [Ignavibacteria bacterium]